MFFYQFFNIYTHHPPHTQNYDITHFQLIIALHTHILFQRPKDTNYFTNFQILRRFFISTSKKVCSLCYNLLHKFCKTVSNAEKVFNKIATDQLDPLLTDYSHETVTDGFRLL